MNIYLVLSPKDEFKTIIDNLPNAGISAIKPIENEDTHEIELFSEIFIYV